MTTPVWKEGQVDYTRRFLPEVFPVAPAVLTAKPDEQRTVPFEYLGPRPGISGLCRHHHRFHRFNAGIQLSTSGRCTSVSQQQLPNDAS